MILSRHQALEKYTNYNATLSTSCQFLFSPVVRHNSCFNYLLWHTWWLLITVEHICDEALLPEGSPWPCPGDNVYYNASIIWGVVGRWRLFITDSIYPELIKLVFSLLIYLHKSQCGCLLASSPTTGGLSSSTCSSSLHPQNRKDSTQFRA